MIQPLELALSGLQQSPSKDKVQSNGIAKGALCETLLQKMARGLVPSRRVSELTKDLEHYTEQLEPRLVAGASLELIDLNDASHEMSSAKDERRTHWQSHVELFEEFSEAELLLATRQFDPSHRLGFGTGATVYRGTLHSGREVAVKQRQVDLTDEVLHILPTKRHPNLVTILGWAGSVGGSFVVYEFVHGVDIATRLRFNQADGGQAFGWVERVWVALDSARGLAHLHSNSPKIPHGNVKSTNIVIDKTGTAKVVDFGFKKWGTSSCKRMQTISEHDDVYAFGVILLELLINHCGLRQGDTALVVHLAMPETSGAMNRVLDLMDDKAQWPVRLFYDVAKIALSCLASNPVSRPPFVAVSRELNNLCKKYGAPRNWSGAVPSKKFESPCCDESLECYCGEAEKDTGENGAAIRNPSCCLFSLACFTPPLELGNTAKVKDQAAESIVGANDHTSVLHL